MTDASVWLDTTFASFDYVILHTMHSLAEWGGWFLTPVFMFISFLGNFGAIELLFAAILLVFKKTRKAGVFIIVAVCLGALMTNVLLKDAITRPRPYADITSNYYQWWNYVGAVVESDHSFPSGHVTAATAAMMALFLTVNKRVSWTGFIFVAIMVLDRCYLMVHYPSDVLAGLFVGALAGALAYFIGNGVDRLLKKRRAQQQTLQ